MAAASKRGAGDGLRIWVSEQGRARRGHTPRIACGMLAVVCNHCQEQAAPAPDPARACGQPRLVQRRQRLTTPQHSRRQAHQLAPVLPSTSCHLPAGSTVSSLSAYSRRWPGMLPCRRVRRRRRAGGQACDDKNGAQQGGAGDGGGARGPHAPGKGAGRAGTCDARRRQAPQQAALAGQPAAPSCARQAAPTR